MRIKKIGEVATITIDKAKEIAKRYRRNKQEPLTCNDAFELWLNRYAKIETKTWPSQKYRWYKYISPHVGDTPLRDLARADVSDLLGLYFATPTLSHRLLELVSSVFEYCRRTELVSLDNPCKFVSTPKLQSRSRYLTRDELARVIRALDTLESNNARVALGMLIFTGCRTNEILGLKWHDVDFANQVIILRTTKNNTTHLVPLSGPTVDLVNSLERNSTWLFPSSSKSGHVESLKRSWSQIKKTTGIDDIRIHDLRRTVGSLLAQDGVSSAIIGDVLNHKSQASTAVYARLNVSTRKTALERFATLIGDHPCQ